MFEVLGRCAEGGWVDHRSVLLVALGRSCWSMLFANVHYTIPRESFLKNLKKVVPFGYFEGFLHGIIFDKATFSLGEY